MRQKAPGITNLTPRTSPRIRRRQSSTTASAQVPYPDVVIRQMYPPRLIDSPGGITCEYFGWEESRLPRQMADDFNSYLDGAGVMSDFGTRRIAGFGRGCPGAVVGIGVPKHDPERPCRLPELESLRGMRFLHISSAFPRKGVDVLLDAFFSTFGGSDDVTLILKTFPNIHNEVGPLLERMRKEHPSPPDVRWIDRDLDAHEIMGLYNLSHCYVHPARGEGFGLPVAEAMAAGVPVIAPAHTGMADFVSDDTATTIRYGIEPARTHFNIPDSMWAEPDRDDLASAMREIAGDPDAELLKQKAERARQLISTEFSWAAVTSRWDAFIADLEESAANPRVAMVSTWNSRCGVAENTRNIVDNTLGSVTFEICADTKAQTIDPARESASDAHG